MPAKESTPRQTPQGPARISRRALGLGAVAAVVGAMWWRQGGQAGGVATKLGAPEAYAAASAGGLVLIDIRRPDEWARTGVPVSGYALDMRRPDFDEKLMALAAENPGLPVALICARGVRSRRLGKRLIKAGFTDVLDVSEGMSGSSMGSGWVKRGLPVRAATAKEKAGL